MFDVGGADLTNWLGDDLKAAKDARWKFVAFHHLGCNSSMRHYEAQQMRLIAEMFEPNKEDVVFTGHVHKYEPTFPLCFKPGGKHGRAVDGQWKLDKNLMGEAHQAEGIIYLVSGEAEQISETGKELDAFTITK